MEPTEAELAPVAARVRMLKVMLLEMVAATPLSVVTFGWEIIFTSPLFSPADRRAWNEVPAVNPTRRESLVPGAAKLAPLTAGRACTLGPHSMPKLREK